MPALISVSGRGAGYRRTYSRNARRMCSRERGVSFKV